VGLPPQRDIEDSYLLRLCEWDQTVLMGDQRGQAHLPNLEEHRVAFFKC
jgi:hypothetical protein